MGENVGIDDEVSSVIAGYLARNEALASEAERLRVGLSISYGQLGGVL